MTEFNKSLGLCIVTDNKQSALDLLNDLAYYHKNSERQGGLQIQTKYYQCQPVITITTWVQIMSLIQQQHTIDCLLILANTTNTQIQNKSNIINNLDQLIDRFNPNTYALVCNSDNEEVNTQEIFDKVQTFIEVVIDNFTKLHLSTEKPKMPQSLLEQAIGITRLVLILESTTWHNMKIKDKQIKFTDKKPNIIKNQCEDEQDESKLEAEMDNFANLMAQMCNIKNSVLSDQQRKAKAEDIVAKLMANFTDKDQEEF